MAGKQSAGILLYRTRAAGIESLYQQQRRLETPHLAIRYKPTRRSTFWRT